MCNARVGGGPPRRLCRGGCQEESQGVRTAPAHACAWLGAQLTIKVHIRHARRHRDGRARGPADGKPSRGGHALLHQLLPRVHGSPPALALFGEHLTQGGQQVASAPILATLGGRRVCGHAPARSAACSCPLAVGRRTAVREQQHATCGRRRRGTEGVRRRRPALWKGPQAKPSSRGWQANRRRAAPGARPEPDAPALWRCVARRLQPARVARAPRQARTGPRAGVSRVCRCSTPPRSPGAPTSWERLSCT